MTVGTASPRPSAKWFALAVAELAAAALVAKLILSNAHDSSTHGHAHHMDEAPGAVESSYLVPHWTWIHTAVLVLTLTAVLWWWRSRNPVLALSTATGLAFLALSQPVRVVSMQSHLVAMFALEVVLVATPLLAISALPTKPSARTHVFPSRTWTLAVWATSALYAGSVLVVHLPVVHQRAAEIGLVPIWTPAMLVLVGTAYWACILRSARFVARKVRRAALLISQELAAFVGLVAIFGGWPSMNHTRVLGISSAWDQRLGGILMMVTCAAVAIPVARRLSPIEHREV
jgi:hypothetical protein